MSKKLAKVQIAMRKLGSIGGKANVKKHGKAHMKRIGEAYRRKMKKAQITK